MKSKNYYAFEESASDLSSYEEQLLLNYDDYLEKGYAAELSASNHYNLELGELEDLLEDDFDSEYDENDWEEEDSENEPVEENDENQEKPGTFIMAS